MQKEVLRLSQAALSLVLPARCLSCGTIVADTGSLCSECWGQVSFLAPPLCRACGIPFPYEAVPDALCADCARVARPYERARAAIVYNDESRRLILGFKHGDRTEAAVLFAKWMARAGAPLLEEAELLIPVPLHWQRLFARRYNQAALLAHGLTKMTGVPTESRLLLRRRRTASQGHLSPQARRRNLAGAFMLAPRAEALLAGKSLLLIDDVMTSGATLDEAAKVLRKAGAASVNALTLARAVRSHPYSAERKN